jgi:hypothetical protein
MTPDPENFKEQISGRPGIGCFIAAIVIFIIFIAWIINGIGHIIDALK